MRSCSVYACCGAPPMAEQPGMAQQRLQTSWHAAHHSSCSSSFALQRHLLGYGTGIERCEQLGQVVHVDVRLKHPRCLRCSTDGRAAGRGPAPPPDQLACSASAVLLM